MKKNLWLALTVLLVLDYGVDGQELKPLELWGAPLGTSYQECLDIWVRANHIPALSPPDPSFDPRSEAFPMYFRRQSYLGIMAQDIQVLFTKGQLSKVRIAFHPIQGQGGFTRSNFFELKRQFDRIYFPSNKTPGYVGLGAAWIFPSGAGIYLGSSLPTELVLILESAPVSAGVKAPGPGSPRVSIPSILPSP